MPHRPPLQAASAALWVRDLESLVAFYRDVIGLEVIDRADTLARMGAGGVPFLHLLHRPDALPDDPASAGLFHIALLLPSRAALGQWLRHASQSGLELDGAADHLVSEAVYLHDPEGNGIEIYADRPAAGWRWTEHAGHKQVEMANDRLDIPGLIAAAEGRWAGVPPATRIGHVHLRVGDMPRAVAFYAGVLGLDVTRMLPQAAFLSTGGYHHHVAANVWHSRHAAARDPARAGLAWLVLEAGDAGLAAAIAGRSGVDDLATGLHDPWGTQVKVVVSPG